MRKRKWKIRQFLKKKKYDVYATKNGRIIVAKTFDKFGDAAEFWLAANELLAKGEQNV